MTIDERIKQLEEQITATNQLLVELKAEREKENKENVLAEYWNRINDVDKVYWNNAFNEISDGFTSEKYSDDNTSNFSNYPSKDFAIMAQKIKVLNDMLLAFKWCYDRNYKPEWDKWTNENKYYVYYDICYETYDYDSDRTFKNNVIYFSSAEIAQKCCAWLNEKLAHGELEEE